MLGRVEVKPLRVLDFDIENRPLSYMGDDYTSGEVTAIAWSFDASPPDIRYFLLNRENRFVQQSGMEWDIPTALRLFRCALLAADIVTGHYIRGHDLPVLNAACMEYGLGPLPKLLVQDTKVDLTSRKYLSASQESLAGMLGIDEAKHHMSQTEWREANRLTDEGLRKTRTRVASDVIQHMALRKELLRRGLLKPPSIWRP